MLQHVTLKYISNYIVYHQLGIFVPRKLANEHLIDVHLLRDEELRSAGAVELASYALWGCRSFCTRENGFEFIYFFA